MEKFFQLTPSHCKEAQQREGVCHCCSKVGRGTTWPKSPKMILQSLVHSQHSWDQCDHGDLLSRIALSPASGLCTACTLLFGSSVNFLGDLMSHGTQDRRAQHYFRIGTLSPLVLSPAFFFFFLSSLFLFTFCQPISSSNELLLILHSFFPLSQSQCSAF